MKKIILALLLMLSVVGLSVVPAFAVDSNSICNDSNLDEEQKQAAGCKNSNADTRTLPEVVNVGLNVAVGVVGILCVGVIIMGGQRYMTAMGEPGKVKQAKDMITWAVVGLVVALLAWAIVRFVSQAVTSQTNTQGASVIVK